MSLLIVILNLNFYSYWPGVTGAEIWIDENGDSEGNFSVLALKESQFSTKDSNFTCDRHMVQVATFQGRNTNNSLPVSEFFLDILNRLYSTPLCRSTSSTTFCVLTGRVALFLPMNLSVASWTSSA
jgi:hypothetical protein